jgi:CRISPR-associated protein (TIGR03985 family)
MSNFSHKPTPEYLSLLVGSRLKDKEVIKKAVRMWYILSRIECDLGNRALTSSGWINSIYTFGANSQPTLNDLFSVEVDGKKEKMPIREDGYISSKKISELLFPIESTRADEWQEWKKSLNTYQNLFVTKNKQQPEWLLDDLEPFYITERTAKDTLKALRSNPMVGFNHENKYVYLEGEVEVEKDTENYQFSDATIEFDSYLELFSNPLEEVTRFYIYTDYKDLPSKKEKIPYIQDKLKTIWQNGKAMPVELTYSSASKGQYQKIVYPLVIYYHQRGFYLCAYDGIKDNRESSWYNYRIDRIEEINILDWEDCRISESIRKKCLRTSDILLIEETACEIEAAYGFDFYQPKEQMVLRFEKNFHDRYIKTTLRHERLKKIDVETVRRLINRKDCNNFVLLKTRIEEFAQDPYYAMPYRINDNTVIMRLRAWGQNVEVLSPPELRDRMRDDIQKNWSMYSQD